MAQERCFTDGGGGDGDPRPARGHGAGAVSTCWRRRRSGGESGYALRFNPQQLVVAGLVHKTGLLRVEYRPEHHDVLFDDIMTWTDEFYHRGIIRCRAPSAKQWAEEFAKADSAHIETYPA